MSITFKVKDINEDKIKIKEFNTKSFLKEYYEKQELLPREYYLHQRSIINKSSTGIERQKQVTELKQDRERYTIKRDVKINNLLNQIQIINSSFNLNNDDINNNNKNNDDNDKNSNSKSKNNDIDSNYINYNIKGLKSVKSNSFIYSCWEAYNNHYHLEIRPDDVYMAIMVQFSFYVNKHSEEFRDRLVDFQGKQNIEVATNEPILNAQHDKLTLELAQKMKSCIKDPSIASWVIPEFTTTTESDKVAFASVLLSTMKSFFNYSDVSKCGLPSVTLLGTIEDWSDIKQRIQKLKEFNINYSNIPNYPQKYTNEYDNIIYKNIDNLMDKWVSLLEPVIDQFILTASGNPDLNWWNSIVDFKQRSGGDKLTGWLSCFACFTNKGDWIGYGSLDSEWPSIHCTHLANGYTNVPILLIDSNGTEYNSTLFSGHIAATSNDDTIIKPSIDWFLLLDPSHQLTK